MSLPIEHLLWACTVLSTLHVLIHLILTVTLCGRKYHYLHSQMKNLRPREVKWLTKVIQAIGFDILELCLQCSLALSLKCHLVLRVFVDPVGTMEEIHPRQVTEPRILLRNVLGVGTGTLAAEIVTDKKLQAWVQVHACLLMGFEVLGQILNPFGPQFPHLQMGITVPELVLSGIASISARAMWGSNWVLGKG